MAATYLIDGYNLLHAMGVMTGPLGSGGLERARLRLLGLLRGALAEDARGVTVVFDAAGAPPGATAEHEFRGIQIVFALGKQEADDVIELLIRQSSAAKSLHVVSDDHRIQRAARRRHCVVVECEELLTRLDRLRREKRAGAAELPEKKGALSEEETRKWLAEFGDLEKDPSLRAAFESYDFER